MIEIKKVKSVINEYGVEWILNRSLYSSKLKMLEIIPIMEGCFEKKTNYPRRLNIFNIDIDELRDFLRGLSDKEKDVLIKRANYSCNGIIIGFQSIELNYGKPIDWQMNPLTGKRCDAKKKWYKIPDFDKEVGDIKIIWEASRFSHFLILARAYLLTNDVKYYRAFRDQLDDWLKNNRYGYGANFKCSQECSFRMINALLSYSIFRQCGIVTDSDMSNMKDLVDRCYRKILSNFFYAYKCIKNNHTISELVGLIVGAWCCNDKNQLNVAYKLLDEVIDEQFTLDGGYKQFSFNYQRLALQDINVVMSIETKTGKSLNINSKNKILNAAILMYQCQDVSGDMPNYGHNDGSLVFPITSCCYRDFRPIINTTYALITGKQLYKEGNHQEELIWFSGQKKLKEYDIEFIEKVSSHYSEAGIYTIRDSGSWAMIILNNYQSRPAHMDQLHFDLWVDGYNVFCDGGTYSYASEEGYRLVKNESHNTITVNGVSQMNLGGPFLIYDWTKQKLGQCDDNFFEGTILSSNGYIHNRKVRYKDNEYEITDKVDKDFVVLFHTPYEVILNNNNEANIKCNNKLLCTIRSSGTIINRINERSLYYLKKENTNCLVIKGQAGNKIKTIIEIKEKKND